MRQLTFWNEDYPSETKFLCVQTKILQTKVREIQVKSNYSMSNLIVTSWIVIVSRNIVKYWSGLVLRVKIKNNEIDELTTIKVLSLFDLSQFGSWTLCHGLSFWENYCQSVILVNSRNFVLNKEDFLRVLEFKSKLNSVKSSNSVRNWHFIIEWFVIIWKSK